MRKLLFLITALLVLTVSAVPVFAEEEAAFPVIEKKPQSVELTTVDKAATLTVKATSPDGGTLTYLWFSVTDPDGESIGTVIEGAESESYTPPKTVGTKYYRVAVINTNASGAYQVWESDNVSVTYKEHTHKYGEWKTVTKSTCTVQGTQTRSCSCGAKESRNLAKLDHSWNAGATQQGEDGDIIWTFTCTECRTKKTEVQKIPNLDEEISSEGTVIVDTVTDVTSQPSVQTDTQPAEEEETDGFPWWIIIVVSVVVVGAGAAVTVLFFMNKD